MLDLNKSCFLGGLWPDNNGIHINAHGGGILQFDHTYYWYGEHKIEGKNGNLAHIGVHVYTSQDLENWTDAGIALDIRENKNCPLVPGCIIERPKVLFCQKTGKFVMYFHYETEISYSFAGIGIAHSDYPCGPFKILRVFRPLPGVLPVNTPPELLNSELIAQTEEEWDKISPGCNDVTPTMSLLGASVKRGQDSRDMTLFLDDDGKAYHISSSEKNSTTHIAELTDDFLDFTGIYWRVFPNRWMEAPCVFKHQGKYYFIASDCTGWAPNAARSAVADAISGPWSELGNPAEGPDSETTFHSQSTYVLALDDGSFIFMADRWCPENAIDGRYLWRKIVFENNCPVIRC